MAPAPSQARTDKPLAPDAPKAGTPTDTTALPTIVRAGSRPQYGTAPRPRPAPSGRMSGSGPGRPTYRVGTPARNDHPRRLGLRVLIGVIVFTVLAGGAGASAMLMGPAADSSATDTRPAVALTEAPARPRPKPTPTLEGDALHPGVRIDTEKLSPEMQRRVNLALAAARKAGVTIRVNDAWRSISRQARLHREAVAKYGTEKEASRWVLPAKDSEHPLGRAVDIGPPAGAKWLEKNGAKFGLCRRYDNEPWHFEPSILPGGTCPARQRDGAAGVAAARAAGD